jgi:hypothetical protein
VQHQEAIRVISRLGPELTKQAAENVLLRYAEEEDLAPAQLEKLAQAYNMVRQLSHIDASEDRGSTCHQINTPALVSAYVGVTQKAAAAPVIVEAPSHDAGSVDLMLELRREMNPVVKAASDGHSDSLEISHPIVPAPSPEADVRYTADQLKEAAWEAKVDFYMIADEVLKMASCEGRTLQIAQAELDASRIINPVCVAETLNWLEKYAAQQKISRKLSRHEGPIKEAAFAITTPLADKIMDLTEAFVVTSLFHKAAVEGSVYVGDLSNSGKVPTKPDAMGAMMSMLEAETPEPPPPGESAPFKAPPRDDERSETAEAASGKGGKGGGSGKKKGEKDTDTDKGGKGHWLASIISGATKPVSAAAGVVDAAASGAQGTIKAVTEKDRVNKNQVKLDSDIMDIRRSILIRRLAASDPVLKDMPLRDVLDTYNAIAESNPEAAANPRRVLLAMREAASYEGITLDAQKSLGDVRGAAAKTDEQESANTKRRYSV